MTLSLEQLAAYLDALLEVERRDDDPAGIYVNGTRVVRRLGLLLEAPDDIRPWVRTEKLDALFLHRPWRLDPGQLPPGVGVVSYHRAFDERLSIGHNPRLAAALGLSSITEFAPREGAVPLGMLGEVEEQRGEAFLARVRDELGDPEVAGCRPGRAVRRVAVVGALTDALVREAAAAGADVYLTGEWRPSAAQALVETGIGIIVTGHERAEAWGLRTLAALIRARFPGVETVIAPDVPS